MIILINGISQIPIMALQYSSQQGNLIKQKYTIKTDGERKIEFSQDFPNCKGLYPDCPEIPSLLDSMCRTCPKTGNLKKPKIQQEE